MASCVGLTALLFLLLAFIGCSICFLAPFWIHNNNSGTEQGLWGRCQPGDDQELDFKRLKGCTWFFQDDFAWENSLDLWYKACQGLFAFGMVIILAALPIGCANLCCGSFTITRVIGVLLLISFVLIGTAVGLFGGMAHEKLGASVNSAQMSFEWGFYVGIPGVCLELFSAILYLFEGCRDRSHDGYSRGDVV